MYVKLKALSSSRMAISEILAIAGPPCRNLNGQVSRISVHCEEAPFFIW